MKAKSYSGLSGSQVEHGKLILESNGGQIPSPSETKVKEQKGSKTSSNIPRVGDKLPPASGELQPIHPPEVNTDEVTPDYRGVYERELKDQENRTISSNLNVLAGEANPLGRIANAFGVGADFLSDFLPDDWANHLKLDNSADLKEIGHCLTCQLHFLELVGRFFFSKDPKTGFADLQEWGKLYKPNGPTVSGMLSAAAGSLRSSPFVGSGFSQYAARVGEKGGQSPKTGLAAHLWLAHTHRLADRLQEAADLAKGYERVTNTIKPSVAHKQHVAALRDLTERAPIPGGTAGRLGSEDSGTSEGSGRSGSDIQSVAGGAPQQSGSNPQRTSESVQREADNPSGAGSNGSSGRESSSQRSSNEPDHNRGFNPRVEGAICEHLYRRSFQPRKGELPDQVAKRLEAKLARLKMEGRVIDCNGQ